MATEILGRIKTFNKFMPACVAAGAVVNNIASVKLTVPAATTLISITTATGVNKVDYDTGIEVPATYGCAVTASASCRVHGVDFYGQPMTETITVSTVPVEGKKAFKKILAVQHVSSSSTDLPSVNITIATSSPLGLPLINIGTIKEVKKGAVVASGTTVVGSLSTTQTATSADPRGTYVVGGTPVAGDEVELVYTTTKYTFKDSNGKLVGGLQGLAHYFVNF